MTDEERETLAQLTAERHVWLTPGCCEPMRRFKVIVMSGCATPDEKPTWVLRQASDDDYEMQVAMVREYDLRTYVRMPPPTCCPFCEKLLPDIVKRADPPSPLMVFDDGYCKTCGERAGRYGNCACWPPWHAWEVRR